MKSRRLRKWSLGGILAVVGAGGLASVSLGVVSGGDVITANRFVLTIDGYQIASFNELTGIVSEIEATEYWAVDENGVQIDKLPGKMKPPTITLKRAATTSPDLWTWHEAVRTGQMAQARRSASLTMFNADGKAVGKYWLEKAWPSKMDLAGLAGKEGALVETVTFTTEYIQRVAP